MPISASSDAFTVNASPADAGSAPTVAGHMDGSYLVAWQANLPGIGPEDQHFVSVDILARLFNGDTAASGDFVVNTELRDPQVAPQAAAAPGGGYVVSYTSGDEDSLPGSYAADQILSSTGAKVGAEYLGHETNYHSNTDVAVAADGRFVVTSTEEFDGQAIVHAADGSQTSVFEFGYAAMPQPVAVASLGGEDYLVLSSGYASEADFNQANDNPGDPSNPVHGLYAQVRNLDGSVSAPFFIAPTTNDNVDPSARVLTNGNVVVTWTDAAAGGTDVYVSIVDPAGAVAVGPFDVSAATAGMQKFPELAVLDDGDFVVAWQDTSGVDGSGAGIEARLFHQDGAPDGGAFIVEQQTTGDQVSPSVAAIGDGQFVVAWEDNGAIEARVLTDQVSPASALFTRPGTLDGSPSPNQTLTGGDGPNSFYFDTDAASGADHAVNFGKNDVLLVTKPLADNNHDGLITFGGNGVLDLDGPGGASDTVRFDGLKAGLRYLGVSDGLSVYADASVRPKGAIEGTVGVDTLHGDAAGTKADVFFYDTALGASLGNDTVLNFGANDILVTTTKIPDNNNDGIIKFGTNRVLNLGPDILTLDSTSGAPLGSLQFEGQVAHDGVTYYVYGAVGGTGSTSSLHFAA